VPLFARFLSFSGFVEVLLPERQAKGYSPAAVLTGVLLEFFADHEEDSSSSTAIEML